jgi:hypothetical protein
MQIQLICFQGPPAQGGDGCFNRGGRYHQGQRVYNNNYRGGGRGYQYQNQAPPHNYFQNQPNQTDQIVAYNSNNNPGAAGRTQSDHRNDTWNQQQQNPNNNAADRPSRGVLKLQNRAPFQAVKIDASIAPTTTSNLTTAALCSSLLTQTGSGRTYCLHMAQDQKCILCDLESLLHVYTQDSQINSNSSGTKTEEDLLPCSLAIIHYIQKIHSTFPLRVLFDTGSDSTFMHEHALPPGATPRVIPKRSGQTLAGLLKTSREVWLQELILPEYSRSCRIDEQHAFVFSGSCDYDIIFGHDFLRKVGMVADFKLGTMTAFDITTPMKHKKNLHKSLFSSFKNNR